MIISAKDFKWFPPLAPTPINAALIFFIFGALKSPIYWLPDFLSEYWFEKPVRKDEELNEAIDKDVVFMKFLLLFFIDFIQVMGKNIDFKN